jgi:hypothetical protein
MVALADWVKCPNYVQMDTLSGPMDDATTFLVTIGPGLLLLAFIGYMNLSWFKLGIFSDQSCGSFGSVHLGAGIEKATMMPAYLQGYYDKYYWRKIL